MKSLNYIQHREKEENKRPSRIPFITNSFWKFINDNANNEEFGFILSINGSKGSGKTTKGLCISQEILETNLEKRRIGIWTNSKTFVEDLKSVSPDHIKDKFYEIKKLSDITNWDIVFVDEGTNIFDPKEALKKEKRNTGKGITIIRHKAVIFIICSVRKKGFFKDMRDDAEIKIYGYCNEEFLQDNKSLFIKKFGKDLMKLNRKESLVNSSYWYFRKNGKLVIDPEKNKKWKWIIDNDEKISRNMRNESLDIEGSQEKQKQQILIEIANILVKTFGHQLIDNKVQKASKAYIKNNRPEYIFYLNFWSDIIEQAMLILYNTGNLSRKRSKATTSNKDVILPKINIDSDKIIVSEYFKLYYQENLKIQDQEYKEWLILLIYNWSNGLSQRAIREEIGRSPNTINKTIKNYMEGQNLQFDELRFAYALEYYTAELLKGIRCGGRSQPDIIFKNENEEILFPGEVKLLSPKGNSISIHKYSKNPNNNSLNPSYLYCKKHKIAKFPLIYFYPKWSEYPLLIPIDVSIDETPEEYNILIEKQDLAEYVENFLHFNKHQFLENKNENNS